MFVQYAGEDVAEEGDGAVDDGHAERQRSGDAGNDVGLVDGVEAARVVLQRSRSGGAVGQQLLLQLAVLGIVQLRTEQHARVVLVAVQLQHRRRRIGRIVGQREFGHQQSQQLGVTRY